MSLDFETGAIVDRKVHFPPDDEGRMNDRLHALIWNLLAIDQGEITEKNVNEVWYRTDLWQRVIGPQFQMWVAYPNVANPDVGNEQDGEWKPLLLTRDDIVHAVGLRTNVGNSTRAAFNKKVLAAFTRNHEERARY